MEARRSENIPEMVKGRFGGGGQCQVSGPGNSSCGIFTSSSDPEPLGEEDTKPTCAATVRS